MNEKFYEQFVKEVQQIVNKAEQALTRCENRMFLNDVVDFVEKVRSYDLADGACNCWPVRLRPGI